MKGKLYRIIPLKIVLLTLCLCVSVVQTAGQEWRTIKDGVEYAEVRREFSGKPVNINLLRMDLKKVRLDVHHAMDAAIGTEKTSSIAARHDAYAAINAGFFRLDTSIFAGDSAGILVIDGKILSEAINNRVVLLINNRSFETFTLIERFRQNLSVDFSETNGRPVSKIAISGINRERKPGEIVLYTPEFHRTTLTRAGGSEVTFERPNCPQVRQDVAAAVIPERGFVLSADASRSAELLRASKCRLRVRFDFSLFAPDDDVRPRFVFPGDNLEDMIAGVPQLIKNRKIEITWEQEKSSKAFVETRHPRTAVAKLKDGKFLMLTADGRTDASAGLDLYDLAAYMLELGATDAMNLDGGGSTTMFLDGKVVNTPSDKEGERKVSDAILVTLRKKK